MSWQFCLVLVVGITLLAFPSSKGPLAAAGPPILLEQDRGRTVDLRRGERLILRLRHPASGGYDVLPPVFDPAVLELVSQKTQPPEPDRPPRLGDFGQLFYEWQAVGPGETDLVIKIKRPWEQQAPEEFWRVKVRVGD